MMDPILISRNFTHHAPKPGHTERYESIRVKALHFAHIINEHCPDSKEKDMALHSLDQAVMWANASIARNE